MIPCPAGVGFSARCHGPASSEAACHRADFPGEGLFLVSPGSWRVIPPLPLLFLALRASALYVLSFAILLPPWLDVFSQHPFQFPTSRHLFDSLLQGNSIFSLVGFALVICAVVLASVWRVFFLPCYPTVLLYIMVVMDQSAPLVLVVGVTITFIILVASTVCSFVIVF